MPSSTRRSERICLRYSSLRDAEVARGGTLADAVQQARPEPAPALVVRLDVERAGAELEDALQHLDRLPQALGAGERAVELDAAAPRRARELDAREVLADADLQVGERLVVLQLDVEARLDVLDQPGFQQQGIDLALGGEEVDVGDELDEVGGAAVLGGGLGEVVAGAVAQVLGLADVEDAALGVLHQVDAGRGGKLLDLLGRRHGGGHGLSRAQVLRAAPRTDGGTLSPPV